MRYIEGFRRLATLGCLIASLTACGGGGGGAAESTATPAAGSPPPANIVFDAVSVSLVAPSSIQREYAEMEESQEISIHVRGAGDLQQLNGRTLYAIVEDPDAMTGGRAAVQLGTRSTDGSNGLITLSARKMDKPGRFQGELRLHACFDPVCATELAGSPLRVPYDVTVHPGLALSAAELAVTVPFGEVPPLQAVLADLPANMSSWRATPGTVIYQAPPNRTQATVTLTGEGKGRIDVQMLPAPPGSYRESIDVSANLSGKAVMQRRSITVTYTVTANPSIDHVFFPAAGHVSVAEGSGAVHLPRVEAYNQHIGLSGMAPTVEYLSHPPAATGHPLVNVWWSDSAAHAYPCSAPPGSGPSRTCLPPGTYTARVAIRYLKGSSIVTVHWPLTMTIVP